MTELSALASGRTHRATRCYGSRRSFGRPRRRRLRKGSGCKSRSKNSHWPTGPAMGTARRWRTFPLAERKALCHSDRKHVGKGLCHQCYQKLNNSRGSPSAQPGLVRVPVKGWGFLSGA